MKVGERAGGRYVTVSVGIFKTYYMLERCLLTGVVGGSNKKWHTCTWDLVVKVAHV